MRYLKSFESNYNNIRNYFEDFIDDGFNIFDIRDWSSQKNVEIGVWGEHKKVGISKGKKYFFIVKLEKHFNVKELENYSDNLIDNLDAAYNRISEFSEYLTIKVEMRSYDRQNNQSRSTKYKNSEYSTHSENCDINQIEKSIKDQIINSRLPGSKNKNVEISVLISISFQSKNRKLLERFENHDDYILQQHYDYIDSINESFGLGDIKGYLKKVFNRIAKASGDHKKKIFIYALTALMMTHSFGDIASAIKSDPKLKYEVNNTTGLKQAIVEKAKESIFKDPTKMKISKNGWSHIKNEEGDPKNPGKPVLTAYKLGDNRITIGWGHAERIKHSKFKVGDVISYDQAQKILEKDATTAADGVRRMFKDWKKAGIEVKVTQDMFDAIVSMAFNMGVSGLRNSDFIKELKNSNYQKAGELIKSTKTEVVVKNDKIKKKLLLNNRRDRESYLFLSFVDKIENITSI